jgi:putative FmdB family regulatory protein
LIQLWGTLALAILTHEALPEGTLFFHPFREVAKLPVYEYRCKKGHTYEKTEGFSAPTRQKCPTCRSDAQRVISMPAVIFKGSGFYSTDNRRGSTLGGASSSDSDSGASESSADTALAAAAGGDGHAHGDGHGHSHGPGGHTH